MPIRYERDDARRRVVIAIQGPFEPADFLAVISRPLPDAGRGESKLGSRRIMVNGHDEHLKALADASDELASAASDDVTAQTPQTRTRVEKAIREYIDNLTPVIGAAAAFQFHASYQTWVDANGRQQRLIATLSGQSNTDAADVELLQQLQLEAEAAMAALDVARTVVQARIDEVD
jgi:hypothetical protein